MKFLESGNRRIFLLVGLVLILFTMAIILWFTIRPQGTRGLQPWLPEPTPVTSSSEAQIPTLSFEELNSDPLTYLNQEIRISGAFLVIGKPECQDYSGPFPQWALVADNLQLDIIGFERIVQLLEAGTSMVIQGTWKHFEGPLGCGKGPERGSIWYLAADRIVQPNPLVSSGSSRSGVIIIGSDPGLPELQPTPLTPSTLVPTMTPDLAIPTADTNTATPTLPLEVTATVTPTGSGTPIPTVTISPTFDSTGPPVTATSLTTTPEATPTPPTAVATQAPGEATYTPESPPVLPTSTQTNGGYPGPNPGTSTATPPPGSYP